jgi:DNA-directed RNA polymerase specialized sigma24 family protein
MADLGQDPSSAQSANDLTARELVVLQHLDKQRTSREVSDLMGLPLDVVRPSIRTVLRKIQPDRPSTDVRNLPT